MKQIISNPHKLLFIATMLFFMSCQPIPQPETIEGTPDIHFYFVQITDTHFGDANHNIRVERIVQEINDLPMDIKFVIHTGDVVSDNILQDSILAPGMAILDKLNMPIHYVPGNHDILKQELDATSKRFEEKIGPLFSVQEYKGVQMIQIFTEPIARAYTLDGYDPLAQLEAALSNGKPSIVFHHRPSAGDFYRNGLHESWDEAGRLNWESILNKYNVIAVLAGHYHRDEHHWLGDVPLYVSAPVGSWWGRQPSYRIYEYSDGKLGYRTQYVLMEPWKNGKIPSLMWD